MNNKPHGIREVGDDYDEQLREFRLREYFGNEERPVNDDEPILASGWWILPGLLLVALLATMFFAGRASAQTQRTATITFTRPTHYTDGTPIAASTVLTYHVFQGARGATKPQVATITATATTINTGLQPGETCWQVSVLANGVESARSNEGCRTFAFPATEPVVITVT